MSAITKLEGQLIEPEAPDTDGFPIVGLGASAGGLRALEEFFLAMPSDSGMAFVVITHLSPGSPSMMDELVGRKTDMPVSVVEGSTRVQANHVYTSLPGQYLSISNGSLVPVDIERPAIPLPIDHFLRSLAEDQQELATCIILSGTGSDGTVGLKDIKAVLGLVIVQQEESAGYTGMPHSAIDTGLVDYVLPPGEMPSRLIAYFRGVKHRPGAAPEDDSGALDQGALEQVILRLRDQVGHDFSQYKANTVRRRVERRMHVHHLGSLKAYLEYLKNTPAENDLVFKELLIGVTSFFRDAAAFASLAEILPKLLANRPDKYLLRVWVPGCSTGEEAYSLAIVLREFIDAHQKQWKAQIFATDLNAAAIGAARAGVYPLGIAGDVNHERLERHFVRDEASFRAKKELRDMVVFAPQNLIGDPPFTKLDLLSCRNLLIYLDARLQRRLMPIFHYALNPDGVLLLGSSESVGEGSALFEPIDKRWRIFQRREVPKGSYAHEFHLGGDPVARTSPGGVAKASPPSNFARPLSVERLFLRELVPPTVLVRERGDIVHIHGRTGQFLEPAPGAQPAGNIFNMAREGLASELAAAIRQASTSEGPIVHRDIRVRANGSFIEVDLRVCQLTEPAQFQGLFLVTFERARPTGTTPDAGEVGDGQKDGLVQLQKELHFARDHHQAAIEELKATNEEVASTNEELQSTNEEFQSANEELETSREEMQSLNEELQAVNMELQEKLEELNRTNDDMRNLLNAADIATIVLDGDLNITRFTERVTNIVRVISSDVGRPLGDLVTRLRYDELVADCSKVLHSLVPKETEVQSDAGQWFLTRIVPYRTVDNVIDGVVITFVDITGSKHLKENEQRTIRALSTSPTMIFGQSRAGHYEWSLGTAFGRSSERLINLTDADLFDAVEADRLTSIKQKVTESGRSTQDQAKITVDGQRLVYDLFLAPAVDEQGSNVGLTGVASLRLPRRTKQ